MLKVSHSTMIFISGLIWMAIGIFLLQLGIHLLFTQTFDVDAATPLVNLFQGIFSPHESAIAIATVALYIGFLKGRHVLIKAANRGIARIKSLPNPASITQLYSKSYFILVGCMVLLGLSIKYLGLPNDVRGAIDIAIGSALINGSMHFFRMGYKLRNQVI